MIHQVNICQTPFGTTRNSMTSVPPNCTLRGPNLGLLKARNEDVVDGVRGELTPRLRKLRAASTATEEQHPALAAAAFVGVFDQTTGSMRASSPIRQETISLESVQAGARPREAVDRPHEVHANTMSIIDRSADDRTPTALSRR
eukprot:CAMPEP_0176057258 /NCGR_PEP_ID=MMETSP0120_2-20121206/28518_1 /TAXON_ID=160619 /ORGANISM="Kryptoperidinium foliaceum, Strain CCMP 1326" /LENGTH=143 /DNA_ID=CAMNT_0017390769 /DNA_START=253 /DNA_END=682 /DNA_ORIENTATION=+